MHAGCLLALLAALAVSWTSLDKPYPALFWVAVSFPVLHQVFVWAAWRLELQRGVVSRFIGFRGYLILFFLLLGGRYVSLLVLAWTDRGSLHLGELQRWVLTGALAVPGLYAMYSTARYFGFPRAAGADHFDPKYREIPFVRQAVFRYTPNGMYLYAFLLFWAIATGLNSSAALAVAAFSHAYIWVHFYATEKPDMSVIYLSD